MLHCEHDLRNGDWGVAGPEGGKIGQSRGEKAMEVAYHVR